MKMKRGGVIISVYVESSSTKDSQHRSNPFKKITHPNQFTIRPNIARKRGYDRRAQLLAYANELRHGNYQQLSWKSHISSNRKHKIEVLLQGHLRCGNSEKTVIEGDKISP
ncbi:hypothetical protein RND71_012286 [Anisodus tanguticus]|uniref:Uncharacterized protein n=1 Tax=Anisodus tanguticus TaxID=243964 RepID=A0AAE1SFE6_9SOLA|nr:hypothetical protein RND71_012286 [Anisodus tanguticus]